MIVPFTTWEKLPGRKKISWKIEKTRYSLHVQEYHDNCMTAKFYEINSPEHRYLFLAGTEALERAIKLKIIGPPKDPALIKKYRSREDVMRNVLKRRPGRPRKEEYNDDGSLTPAEDDPFRSEAGDDPFA